MNWIEDSAIREWVCSDDGNVFSAIIRYEPWVESYTVRIKILMCNEPVELFVTSKHGTLESAKAWVEATLRDIAAQAIALAESQNK